MSFFLPYSNLSSFLEVPGPPAFRGAGRGREWSHRPGRVRWRSVSLSLFSASPSLRAEVEPSTRTKSLTVSQCSAFSRLIFLVNYRSHILIILKDVPYNLVFTLLYSGCMLDEVFVQVSLFISTSRYVSLLPSNNICAPYFYHLTELLRSCEFWYSFVKSQRDTIISR